MLKQAGIPEGGAPGALWERGVSPSRMVPGCIEAWEIRASTDRQRLHGHG